MIVLYCWWYGDYSVPLNNPNRYYSDSFGQSGYKEKKTKFTCEEEGQRDMEG